MTVVIELVRENGFAKADRDFSDPKLHIPPNRAVCWMKIPPMLPARLATWSTTAIRFSESRVTSVEISWPRSVARMEPRQSHSIV